MKIEDYYTEQLTIIMNGLNAIYNEYTSSNSIASLTGYVGICDWNIFINGDSDCFLLIDDFLYTYLPVHEPFKYCWVIKNKQSRITWLKTHIQKIETELRVRDSSDATERSSPDFSSGPQRTRSHE